VSEDKESNKVNHQMCSQFFWYFTQLELPISTFITKFPIVVGKDTILVIYNRLSKITHFVTVIKDILAKELARLFRNNI